MISSAHRWLNRGFPTAAYVETAIAAREAPALGPPSTLDPSDHTGFGVVPSAVGALQVAGGRRTMKQAPAGTLAL